MTLTKKKRMRNKSNFIQRILHEALLYGLDLNYVYLTNRVLFYDVKYFMWVYDVSTFYFHPKYLLAFEENTLIFYRYVRDISFIRNINTTYVKYIDLWGSGVRDFSPLFVLSGLKSLDLRANNISEIQLEKLKECLPNCEIFHDNPVSN